MRILVVEDERPLARVVARGLTEEGHAVDVAHDCATARWHVNEQDYAVILLDLGLPDGDGTDLCRELRSRKVSARVLMLTARDAVRDRIVGLDSGADDYLAKPFDFGELNARVRALLRRPEAVRATELVVGDLRLDTIGQRALLDGTLVPLTTKEFALLLHLASRADAVVSRSELIDELWDAHYDGVSNVVDVHVRNLRRKLDRPGQPFPIETVRGAGYRLSANEATDSTED
jgi:DNA-binding response OmpR family regulator